MPTHVQPQPQATLGTRPFQYNVTVTQVRIDRMRALPAGRAFWFCMFGASVFGTNLGDFWVDSVALDRWASFLSLAAVAALAVLADRLLGRRTDLAYWVAVVTLRAAATNIADLLTHDLGFGFAAVSLILGAATVVAARLSHPVRTGGTSPIVDHRYWVTMLLAGLFGTTAGDWATSMFGLPDAAVMLSLTLLIVLGLRSGFAATSVVGYWSVVMAERCAGTPVGDFLASDRFHGLGLPLATTCGGGLLLTGLAARAAHARITPPRISLPER